MKKQERIENLDAIVTPWPAWIYKQYDPKRLALKIRHHLQFIETSELREKDSFYIQDQLKIIIFVFILYILS